MKKRLLLLGGASASGKSTFSKVAEKHNFQRYRMAWSVIEVAFEKAVNYADIPRNWQQLSGEASDRFVRKMEECGDVVSDTHFALQLGLDNALALDVPFTEDLDEFFIRGYGEPFVSKIVQAVDEIYFVFLDASPMDLLKRRKQRQERGIRPRSLNPISILREAYFERSFFDEAYAKAKTEAKYVERHIIPTSTVGEADLEKILLAIVAKERSPQASVVTFYP